MHKENVLFL